MRLMSPGYGAMGGGDLATPSGNQDVPSSSGKPREEEVAFLHGEMPRYDWKSFGGTNWRKSVEGAAEIPQPKDGQVVRRVVRNARGGDLVDNLWISPSTSEERKAGILQTKMDIDVVVDVCAVDTVPAGEGERLLDGKKG